MKLILLLLVLSLSSNIFAETKREHFIHSIMLEDEVSIRSYIDSGANLNPVEDDGLYPILAAATFSNAFAAELLLKNGASPDPVGDNVPLGTACANGSAKVIRLLIKYGADPNYIEPNTKNSITCLMTAIKRNHVEAAEVLLENGADPNVRDQKGRTARDHSKLIQLRQKKLQDVLDLYLSKAGG